MPPNSKAIIRCNLQAVSGTRSLAVTTHTICRRVGSGPIVIKDVDQTRIHPEGTVTSWEKTTIADGDHITCMFRGQVGHVIDVVASCEGYVFE